MKRGNLDLVQDYFCFRRFFIGLKWLTSSTIRLMDEFVITFPSVSNLFKRAEDIISWYNSLGYSCDYYVVNNSIEVIIKEEVSSKMSYDIGKFYDFEVRESLLKELYNYNDLFKLSDVIDSDEGLWTDYYKEKIMETQTKLLDLDLTLLPETFNSSLEDFKRFILDRHNT